MYTFTDRGGDSITRCARKHHRRHLPRAGDQRPDPVAASRRCCYAGPMFRYERPQKGRYRQFHQIDIEVLGSAEPLADAEVIACGWDILQSLGVAGDAVLEINTLGDKESRSTPAPRRARGLFHRAPGCIVGRQPGAVGSQPVAHPGFPKDEGDRRIIANAPLIADHLTAARRRGSTPGCRAICARSACRSGRTRGSSVGWTTTATRRSSSSPASWDRRGR